MDSLSEEKNSFDSDKFWRQVNLAWRIAVSGSVLAGCTFAAWMTHDIVTYDPELIPGKIFTQTAEAYHSPDTPTPLLSSSETPVPQATLDEVAVAISSVKATDTARTNADFSHDFDLVPKDLRQSAVLMRLYNSQTKSFCSATLIDKTSDPAFPGQDILISVTGVHCLTDQNNQPFTSAALAQPYRSTDAIVTADEEHTSIIRGPRDFGVVAMLAPTGTVSINPLGLDHFIPSAQLQTGEQIHALSFNLYAPKHQDTFPANGQITDPIPHAEMMDDFRSFNVISAKLNSAPGSSGAGVVDENGNFIGTIVGGLGNQTAICQIPTNYQEIFNAAIEGLKSKLPKSH